MSTNSDLFLLDKTPKFPYYTDEIGDKNSNSISNGPFPFAPNEGAALRKLWILILNRPRLDVKIGGIYPMDHNTTMIEI